MLDSLYELRAILMVFLISSVILAYKYKTPLDRLIMMFLDLQIMSSFCLLHITMPANYVVLSAIIKPLVSLNIFRDYIGLESSLEIAVELSEEDLAYLGQRT